MINGWRFSTRTCGYFSFSEPLQLYFAFLEILLLQPINWFRFLFSEMSSIRAIRRLNCAVKSIIVQQARNFSALPAGKLQDYNFSRLSSYRAVTAFVVPHYMLSADFMSSSLVCAKQMSSAAIVLKKDGDVVRFSFDKNAHRNGLSTNENEKKMSKRVKMSRKAKLNELRFYRLKAKKKMNSPNPEVRIRYKLEKAKRKEAWLIEKLRKFEVLKAPAETHDLEMLTEEDKHYLKRTGEKKMNYVQVGRRGVFGGVVLNMHLHWKKHETVKLICKPCRPGQIHQYAEELAQLSKGIIIDIKPNNTTLFYRGKNYVRPEVMSPPTLSKNKALERYRYMQSLEHTNQFIDKLEKELEEYQDHVARYRKMKEVPPE